MDAIVSQLNDDLKSVPRSSKSFSVEGLLGIDASESQAKPSITMSALLDKYRTPQKEVIEDLDTVDDSEDSVESNEELESSIEEPVELPWGDVAEEEEIEKEEDGVKGEEESIVVTEPDTSEVEIEDSSSAEVGKEEANKEGIVAESEIAEDDAEQEPVVRDVIQRSFSALVETSRGIQKLAIEGCSVDETFLKDNGFKKSDITLSISVISEFLGAFSRNDLDNVVQCAYGVGGMDCFVRFESPIEDSINSLCIFTDRGNCLSSSVTIYSKNTDSRIVSKLMEVLVCL